MEGPIAFPFVEGTKLFASRGQTGASGNWYCGLHEVHEMAFVLHLLRDGEHFIDVGANVGSYTVLAAASGARVTAFEPIPKTFAALERNVALNNLDDLVSVNCMGISDQSLVLRFSSEMDTVNHVLAEGEEAESIEVPVSRLDELVKKDVPVLIKIDVEGHERSVLLGAERILSSQTLLAVILETNGSGARYGIGDDELLMIMRKHGFSPYSYDAFSRCLTDPVENQGNTFFVRDPEAVSQRVTKSRCFRLVNGEI